MITYSSEQTDYFEQLLKPEDLEKLPLYETYCELLENCKKNFSECPAISDLEVTINYGELYERIAHRRAFLYEQGFQKGDIIAVLAPNCMAAMELYMAIPTGGYTVIMLPATENALNQDILSKLINKFDIKGLFIHSLFEEIAKNQKIKVYSINETSSDSGIMADVRPEDTAVICFSERRPGGKHFPTGI